MFYTLLLLMLKLIDSNVVCILTYLKERILSRSPTTKDYFNILILKKCMTYAHFKIN